MTKRGQDGGGKGEKWDVRITLLMRSAHFLFIYIWGGLGSLVGGGASWMIHHTLGDVSSAACGSHLNSELPVSRHDFYQLSLCCCSPPPPSS